MSAIQGMAQAQSNVGFCYANGKGVEQSDTKAYEYCKLAADQGDFIAQYNLGFMYTQGAGVIKSDELAFTY